MATYQTTLRVPSSVDDTFSFVSDFRNAVRWDPRTYATGMDPEGPVGVGTRFLLTGGLLREETVRRLRLPLRIVGRALPYDVAVYEPPRRFVLVGQTRTLHYRDELEFEPAGDHTSLRYVATLEAKPFARLWEPLLGRLFQRIGDEATAGLAAAVLEGTTPSDGS